MARGSVRINIEATVTLELSEEEFRILHHVTAYSGFAEAFFKDFSKTVPAEKIDAAIRSINSKTERGITAVDNARNAVYKTRSECNTG